MSPFPGARGYQREGVARGGIPGPGLSSRGATRARNLGNGRRV